VETLGPSRPARRRQPDVVFDDVVFPLDHEMTFVCRRSGERPTSPKHIFISAIYDGIARAARDWLIGLRSGFRPPGAPLATWPRAQEVLAVSRRAS
jgi:hypothetical protein